ncbi:MAG: DUF2806 domain-containing protein [Thermoguttaceae bacterium]|jgi:hypothetical protein
MDFKDLAGLSEPLKRLIEVIAEGIGGVSRHLLTRKNADAKAYEIRTIAQAIAESQKLLGPVKYENGSILIEASASVEQTLLPEATWDQRVISRMAFQEAKKQSNIEYITQQAAEELRDEKSVTQERPDSDWITHFFRIAEDITTDQMQMLWGKILAGEVKKPGSYSLRALDLLKNITKQEAEIFERVGRISFQSEGKAFVPNPDNGKYLKEYFGLKFTDFLMLREVNLLVANDLEFQISPVEQNAQIVFTCGNTCVLIKRSIDTPQRSMSMKVIVFTEIGHQLLQLIERTPADPNYIKKFASFFRSEGVTIYSGLIVEWQGDGFHYNNLYEVPAESDTKKG